MDGELTLRRSKPFPEPIHLVQQTAYRGYLSVFMTTLSLAIVLGLLLMANEPTFEDVDRRNAW